jgi:hypothetical protein
MRFPGSTRLFALTGLMAFCAFAGDIVADSLADACGEHCISQSSQSNSQDEKAPCSHCSCAVHNGSVLASSNVVQISGALDASAFVLTVERSAPDGIPRAIDHPPQLA